MRWDLLCFFHVFGVPKGQPRVRAFRRGNHAGVYDPGTADEWKALIQVAARPYLPPSPIDRPCALQVELFFPRPKRLETRKSPTGAILHTAKPDGDNALKAVMDCLTQAGMWKDDALVASSTVTKFYVPLGERPGAQIRIMVSND